MKVLIDQHRETPSGVEVGYWADGDRIIKTIPCDHQPQPIIGEMFEIEKTTLEVEAPAIAPPKTSEKEEEPKAPPTTANRKKPEVEVK